MIFNTILAIQHIYCINKSVDTAAALALTSHTSVGLLASRRNGLYAEQSIRREDVGSKEIGKVCDGAGAMRHRNLVSRGLSESQAKNCNKWW